MAETTTSQDYLTSDDLKADLSLTGQTFADHAITRSITAASRMVDQLCNRFFYQDSVATPRVFTPIRYDVLAIHDLVSATTVKTDVDGSFAYAQTWTVNVDYVFHGANQALIGWPYTDLVYLPMTSNYALDPTIINSVQITGIWGWPAVPAQVQEATSILATQLIKRKREAPFGIVSYDGYAMRMGQVDAQVKTLLAPFQKHARGIA